MHIFRKFLSVLLIFLMISSSMLFAGGGKEKESDDSYTAQQEFYDQYVASKLGSNKHTPLFGVLHSIANIYDEITAMFCMAMSPFPSMFVKFYSEVPPGLGNLSSTEEYGGSIKTYVNYPELRLRSSLLFKNNYYTEDMPTGSQGLPKLTFTRESDGAEMVFVGRPQTSERGFFGMVSILFFSLFLLEVLFTAIYGYLTDKDGGVFRDIVSKGVLCILLFLLASALPFLVEAFRVGFISMAGTAAGIDQMIENSTGTQRDLYLSLKYSSVYEYPGLLIRSLADVIDMLNPSNIGMTGINLTENAEIASDDANFIVKGIINNLFKLLISVVYMIIQIIAAILILFSALHVVLNVCEVYLLLAGVMCLIPFTVFSPLKFLGEKAVMSLFSNIMELFILVLIMFTSLAVGTSISKSVLNTIAYSPTEIAITFTDIHVNSSNTHIEGLLNSADFSGMYINAEGARISKEQYDKMSDEEKEGVTLAPITIVVEDNISVDNNSLTQDKNEQSAAIEKWINDLAVDVLDLRERPELHSAYDSVMINEIWQSDAESIDPTKLENQIQNINFTSLPISDKIKVIEALDSEVWRGQLTYSVETLAAMTETKIDLSFFVTHIILSFLAIFMSTYFVNQSSQITNALLSGNVASEGLTAAMGKALAGKAMGMAGKIAAKPVKATGASVGTAMGAMGDKAAASGHTGLASALYMGGGKAAQARHDRQKMIDDVQTDFGKKKSE